MLNKKMNINANSSFLRLNFQQIIHQRGEKGSFVDILQQYLLKQYRGILGKLEVMHNISWHILPQSIWHTATICTNIKKSYLHRYIGQTQTHHSYRHSICHYMT